MKYTLEITINKPIEQVIEFFKNPNNKSKWMEGLKTYQHLSGTQGESGSKYKMELLMNNQNVEMIETITSNNLPVEFSATYEANGVLNIQKTRFVKISEQETKYISENEFKLNGFMKIVGLLMPGSFKKQTKKYLNNFKIAVESA